jgi:hypothetical protein
MARDGGQATTRGNDGNRGPNKYRAAAPEMERFQAPGLGLFIPDITLPCSSFSRRVAVADADELIDRRSPVDLYKMLPLPLLHLVAGLGALLLAPAPAAAGSVPDGKTCNVNNNRLLAGTNQFYSDCDSTTYCESSNSTCVHQGCRNAIFPLQKYPFATPPICGSGEFCPDEQSKCLPLVAVGDQCQLNRDGAPPPPHTSAYMLTPSRRPVRAAAELRPASRYDRPRAERERVRVPEQHLHVRSSSCPPSSRPLTPTRA